MAAAEALLGIICFFIGACIFSFLNVVIYRVPKKEGFIKGNSYCPSCGHKLSYPDMIPVLSWIFLRGKCRYCKAKIPAVDTIREAIGGALAIASVLRFGWTGQALTVFAFICILWCIGWVDAQTMEIPDGFIIAVLAAAVLSVFTMTEVTWPERLIGAFCTSVPLFLITLLIPGAFGGGDIKLLFAAGILLGWKMSLLALFLGILGGGIYGFYLLATKKKGRKEHFAFGPFLCTGIGITVFFGSMILNWYMSFYLV